MLGTESEGPAGSSLLDEGAPHPPHSGPFPSSVRRGNCPEHMGICGSASQTKGTLGLVTGGGQVLEEGQAGVPGGVSAG